ncbi:MAG: DNA polymerase III subunit gamma/tau [Pseudomonadota bacterium]
MSYLVLARKWRPHTFADVVGQQHVLKALAHSLDNNRLHHAYLFAGTRGVGKTTLARILAKALNCEQGVSAEPCGTCSACVEIDEGRFVDLIEVDAASRTKVDDTRELLDNVQYAATRGRFKVYLIDEVHMLSTHSFNALLKTLEEPPEHVKFLLATTDPQKLPVTVLSRCLQFNLKRLTPAEISGRLRDIATAEGVDAEEAALALLARAADGSLRDSLSLADQAIAFGGGKLVEQDVASMLGAMDRQQVTALLQSLADHDGDALLNVIAEVDAQFPDYARLLDDLAERLSALAVFHATGACDDDDEQQQLADLAGLISPADAQLYYQIALHGKRDLPLAPQPRVGIEMTLLRMLAFTPGDDSATNSAIPGGNPSSGATTSRGPQTAPAAAAVASQSRAGPAKQPPGAAAPPQRNEAPEGVGSTWHRTVGQLELSGFTRLLAANCACIEETDTHVSLALDKRSESMLTPAREQEIGNAMRAHLGRDVTVTVTIEGQTAAPTPVQMAHNDARRKTQDAQQTLEEDAGIAAMKKLFDAEVDPESIQLVGDKAANPTARSQDSAGGE